MWVPQYRLGDEAPTYGVEIGKTGDVGLCPRDLITPWAVEIVDQFDRAHRGKDCGASMFGPDLSRWPARMVDVLVVIETERIRQYNAEQEAIYKPHNA